MKIAILGAGVSGLSLARFLIEGGIAKSDLHLFEASSKIGGLCGSKTVDGFTYDETGGHILYSKDQAAMRWMIDCAGGDSAFEQRERQTKIRFGDRWVHYPFENGLGDLPPQANFDCLKGYVHAWHRRQAERSPAPTEFGAWVRWRFGDGIAHHFMDPYNQKVWKRELHELSSDWVAGRVPDAPIEDVLKSSVGIRTEGYTHQSLFYYPQKGGFQAITDGIGSTLLDRVRLKTPVREVKKRGDVFQVNGEDFDGVVSTLALTDLPKLIVGMPQPVAKAMETLEYNSIVCLLVALDEPEQPPLSWIYLPHDEQGPTNRVTYMSNYATANAPAGKSSFLCEVTFRGGSAAPGAELEGQVLVGLERAGLLRREQVLFTDRTVSRHAYVVFDHAYGSRREAALGWLVEQGIEPLGRFGRFEYDNSDQCVIKARATAARLLATARRGGGPTVR
ncbi:MAG: FAD-dependent oxidoreductase [Planctomycetes bacterium]|nr:FAD-dependent oxidoreductase [Planctomycetota bacterium]